MLNSVKMANFSDKSVSQQENMQALPVKTEPSLTNPKLVQSVQVQQHIQRYRSGNFGESLPRKQP